MLFNKNWTFYKLDKPEEKSIVDLPFDAMLRESRDISNPGGDRISFFKGDDYVYEKEIDIVDENLSYYFYFEGIYHVPSVYINDKLVTVRRNGYLPIFFNADKYLKIGKNVIKVVSINSDQPNSRWYTGSGIYRNVHFYALPKPHIIPLSFHVNTIDYQTGKIEIKAILSSNTSAILQIKDNNSNVVAKRYDNVEEINDEIIVENPHLWSVDDPYLYTARLMVVGQDITIKFGIRGISLDKEKGLLINGNKVVLNGACIHSDNGLFGAESYKEVEYRKVRQLKELGYNAVRSAHNPICSDFLDVCDELGLYVIDEYCDSWFIRKTKYDYANYMEENYEQDLEDIVRKDYSHPSVIMYSTGNEVSETAFSKGIELQKKMNELLHDLDNTRLTTCGINVFFNGIAHLPFAQYSDKKALKKTKINGSSGIFNDLANIFGAEFMKTGATISLVDKYTRDAFSHMDVAGYNYGIKRYKEDLKNYPDRFICGLETFVSDFAKFNELAKDNPRLIGDFVWTGLDYLGEAGFASEANSKDFNYKEDPSGWLTSDSGRKDIIGDITSEGDYVNVVLKNKVIDIGVVSPYDIRCKCKKAAWRFNHAIKSYSFPGEEENKCIFYVYSNAPRIEFYQNETLIKDCNINKDKCYIKFVGKYIPGKIRAVAYNEDKTKVLDEVVLKTAKENIMLRYYKEDNNKNDKFVYVHFSFEDEERMIKPHDEKNIKITDVSGGKLFRLGSGASYNKVGYLTNEIKTYHARALAIFEFDEGSNEITFTIYSELGDKKITLKR